MKTYKITFAFFTTTVWAASKAKALRIARQAYDRQRREKIGADTFKRGARIKEA